MNVIVAQPEPFYALKGEDGKIKLDKNGNPVLPEKTKGENVGLFVRSLTAVNFEKRERKGKQTIVPRGARIVDISKKVVI